MNYFYFLIAILAGAIFALQPPLNASIARTLNNPLLAALVSFSVGTIVLLIINLIIGIKFPPVTKLQTLPWWVWLSGGTIGAFVVSTVIVIQPKIGAASWVACYVFGQLVMSVLIDNYGLLNSSIHPVDFARLLGVFFLAIGAILIACY